MKNFKRLALCLVLLITYNTVLAQQQGINYKALIKDANGNVLNEYMTVQFTIHATSTTGTIVYQEDQTYTTIDGLLILSIGTSTNPSIGVFADIDWAADTHFLNTTITYDSTGPKDLGTTQFMAVPYAKHATTSSDTQWEATGADIKNKNTGKVTIENDFEVTGNITLQTGATINEISIDATLADNSDTAVPTEQAVKTYVDNATATTVTSINDLSDGKASITAVYLGEDAGFTETLTDRINVGIGNKALYSNTTGNFNIAIGYEALYGNTTGDNNTANGVSALASNTTGYNNTAIGSEALIFNTTGVANTAIGRSTLTLNTSGHSNTAIGSQALESNTTGIANTAIGRAALNSNITGYYNVANGYRALNSNTTGSNNTANGFQALYSNTIGDRNTANGYEALYSNTTGSNNTANGFEALYFNTTGNDNVANGYQALRYNTTGSNNTANGSYSLNSNTIGFNNIAIGNRALYSNTTGYNNTANGFEALFNNTTGFGNTANGNFALLQNTTGDRNTANGYQALLNNTIGNYNVANGTEALYSNTTGSDNTANGLQALYSNISGYDNTANGREALYSNTTGYRNTANGYGAFSSNTTGSGNVAIGFNAGYNETGSNTLYIANSGTSSPLIYGEFDTKKLTINGTINSPNNANPDIVLGGNSSSAAGDDGIISSDPSYTGSDIWLRSNDAVVVQLDFDNNESGNFEIKNSTNVEVFDVSEAGNLVIAGSLTQNSDRRLKKNIADLSYGLKEILQLQPKAYNWKSRETNYKSLGLIAQDVQPIIKEIVNTQDNEQKTLGVSYTELIPVLINAIKEQQAIIKSLKKEHQTGMSAMLERIEKLEALNNQ